MKDKTTEEEISVVLNEALKTGLINNDDTSVIFYDLSFIKERIDEVKRLFPAGALHGTAVKANPLTSVLKIIKEYGVNIEAASLPEFYLAEKTGYEGKRIIFDSPAKTEQELEYVIGRGAHINADSLEELELINKILAGKKSQATFGLRINPQAGTGKILLTSVAGEYSKFGVPVKEFRKEIIDSYLKYDWLTGVHLHVGSQGCPLDLLIKGIDAVYNLALEINSLLIEKKKERKINFFDIGGGVPVNYRNEDKHFTMAEYAAAVKNKFPLLFTERFRLITEFGRYYNANSAFAVSRIDNIKKQKEITTIISHLGADFLIRHVYSPEFWHHDISVTNKQGRLKTGSVKNKYIIGGPLCFAGDVVAKEILLPPVEKGDYLILHDVGAYTYSMWSRYNSRQMPKVIGYYNNGEKFIILKERESLQKVFQFWS
jgi:diaminopimelate decarboxylase